MADWGRTVQNDTSTEVSDSRAMGGTFDGGANQVLTSISMYLGGSGDIRLAVYQGGALDPDGPPDAGQADLIWDGGVVNVGAEGFYTVEHPGPYPALTNNEVTWVAWKSDDGTVSIWYTTTSAGAGDFQTTVGRWQAVSGPDPDETAGWPSSWPSGDTGSYGAFWYSNYLTHVTIGIASVTPTEFDMDAPDLDILGGGFGATQGTGSVYLSDATTLAGSTLEVDLDTVIGTWAAGTISNIDLSSLSAGLLDDLHTLGPGARYVIVQNDNDDETSFPVTLHRPHGFEMVGSSFITDTGENTSAELTAPAGKDTGDFGGGRAVDLENPDNTTVNLATDEYREDLWNMQAKTLSREVQYQFRVVVGGVVLGTYSVDPRVTISDVVPVYPPFPRRQRTTVRM